MNQAGAGPTLALGPCRTHLPMGFGQLPHGVRCADGSGAVGAALGNKAYQHLRQQRQDEAGASMATQVIRMPEHYGELSPLLHVVPLQLLAYHTACARGTDVDKPRNLAKSVTVE